jgi:hypothetical protein
LVARFGGGPVRATEIFYAVIFAVLAAEFTDYATASSTRIARAAAHLRYGRTARGKIRAEEWETVVKERPGQLLRLFTALAFLLSSIAAISEARMRAAQPAIANRVATWRASFDTPVAHTLRDLLVGIAAGGVSELLPLPFEPWSSLLVVFGAGLAPTLIPMALRRLNLLKIRSKDRSKVRDER